MRIVIYPGSFDPITNGHLDVLQRAAALFDKVIVTVGTNRAKTPMFTTEERIEMIVESTAHLANVEVDSFSGLLVDDARLKGACAIIRGLRAFSDFEFEFQLALMNRHMEPDVATVFLMPNPKYTHLNSSIIREVSRLGRDVTDFVPEIVSERLKQKFAHE